MMQRESYCTILESMPPVHRVGRLVGLASVLEFDRLLRAVVPDDALHHAADTALVDIFFEVFSKQLSRLTWEPPLEHGELQKTDVANVVLLMRESGAMERLDGAPKPSVAAVVLIPSNECCTKAGCGGKLRLERAQGRAFDVRFLDALSLPGFELAKKCVCCERMYYYSEIRWRHPLEALAANPSLPAGEQREWQSDAGGREYWRWPAESSVAYHSGILDFSTIADERTQFSKQGLQSVCRLRAFSRVPRKPSNEDDGDQAPSEAEAAATWCEWERRIFTEAWFARELLRDERELSVPLADRAKLEDYLDKRRFNAALRRQGYRGRAALRHRYAERHRYTTTRPGRAQMVSFDGLHKANTQCCITEIKYQKRLPGSSAYMYQGCMGDCDMLKCAVCIECLEEGGERRAPSDSAMRSAITPSGVSSRDAPPSLEDEIELMEPPLDSSLASALQVSYCWAQIETDCDDMCNPHLIRAPCISRSEKRDWKGGKSARNLKRLRRWRRLAWKRLGQRSGCRAQARWMELADNCAADACSHMQRRRVHDYAGCRRLRRRKSTRVRLMIQSTCLPRAALQARSVKSRWHLLHLQRRSRAKRPRASSQH